MNRKISHQAELLFFLQRYKIYKKITKNILISGTWRSHMLLFYFPFVPSLADSFTPTGPSGTNIIIGSVAGAILLAAIVLGGTGWGFK